MTIERERQKKDRIRSRQDRRYKREQKRKVRNLWGRAKAMTSYKRKNKER